jgi:hypothetical protein
MNENMQTIVGADSSFAAQYFDTFRRSEPLEPEKALLLAILKDAIDTYRKYRGAQDRIGKDHFREAEEWLMGGGDDWLFAFDSVCALLDLDPDYIRRGVRGSTGRIVESEHRPRRPRLRRRPAA